MDELWKGPPCCGDAQGQLGLVSSKLLFLHAHSLKTEQLGEGTWLFWGGKKKLVMRHLGLRENCGLLSKPQMAIHSEMDQKHICFEVMPF